MLMVHGEDRAALESNIARLKAEGKTQPRHHAESRPPYVEAAGTRMAVEMARTEDAPVYLVHLSSQAALAEVRAGRAVGARVFVETCPHFLVLDESRYELPDEECACYIISPPLRPPADRDAMWAGLADGSIDVVSTDHVPDTVADKRGWDECFDQVSNGAPGIETLLTNVYGEGVARSRMSIQRMVDVLSTTPARLFGMPHKGAIEVGRDADLVLFDPQERRTITQSVLHHISDFTPYEGLATSGLVRSTIVRGEFVVRDGHFVGRRGYGRFQERDLTSS
jgi:dihydropyrimidinase